jgi:hypothetical protein
MSLIIYSLQLPILKLIYSQRLLQWYWYQEEKIVIGELTLNIGCISINYHICWYHFYHMRKKTKRNVFRKLNFCIQEKHRDQSRILERNCRIEFSMAWQKLVPNFNLLTSNCFIILCHTFVFIVVFVQNVEKSCIIFTEVHALRQGLSKRIERPYCCYQNFQHIWNYCV